MPELPVSWRCILRLSALTAQHIKRRQLPARTAQQDSLLAAPATPMHPGQRSKLTNHLALLLLLLLLCLMMVPQVQAAPTETDRSAMRTADAAGLSAATACGMEVVDVAVMAPPKRSASSRRQAARCSSKSVVAAS